MGLLTELLRQRHDDKWREIELQKDMYASVLKDPNARPETKEGAVEALLGLAGESGKGGKGGKGQQTSPLRLLLSSLAGGQPMQMGQAPGQPTQASGPPASTYSSQSSQMAQLSPVPSASAGGGIPPQRRGLFYSPEEQAQLENQLAIQRETALSKVREQVQLNTARQQRKEAILADQDAFETRLGIRRAHPEQFTDETGREFVTGIKPRVPSVAEQTLQSDWEAWSQKIGKPVSEFTGQDKVNAKNAADADRAKQMAEAAGETKRETGELGQREEALRDLQSSDPVKRQAAKDTLHSLDLKAKGAEQRIVIQNQNAAGSNSPIAPATKSFLADLIIQGKPVPYGLLRGMSKRATAELLAELPKLAAEKGMTVGDVIARQGDVKALDSALSKLETNFAQISAFEKTAQANLDRAIDAAKKIVDTGSPWVNVPWRRAEQQLAGKPELAAFHAARVTAFTEVSKVLNNPTGQGAVSDSARKEAEGALEEGATLAQLQAAADILKQDMSSRISSMQETIEGIKSKLAEKPPTLPTLPKPSKPGARISPDDAAKYLQAAGGDMQKAKDAARKDGWGVP